MEKKATFSELIQGDQPVLVDFSAAWCGPCKMMEPILQETAKSLGDEVKIIKIDVDRNPAAASAYQVMGVPTLILFHQGKVMWRQSGVVPTHQLVQTLRQHTAKLV